MVNLCVLQKDLVREQMYNLCKKLPRSYEEIAEMKEKMKWTIKAIEKGGAMRPGSEEPGAMKTFLRMQMTNGVAVPFPNDAVKAATTDMMVKYSDKGEADPDFLTVDRVFDEWMRVWKKTAMITAARSASSLRMTSAASVGSRGHG